MDPQNFYHFGHRHVLTPLILGEGCVVDCNACESQILANHIFHGCVDCKYYLHDHCLNISRSILHPSHPNHPLTLLSAPSYPFGYFGCNACGKSGSGFCYVCAYCEFDLHVNCARLPGKVNIKQHKHEVKLEYIFVFYEDNTNVRTKKYSNYMPGQKCFCDVCNGVITANEIWRYRCGGCDFDAHVGCVDVVNKCRENELLVNRVVEGKSGSAAKMMQNQINGKQKPNLPQNLRKTSEGSLPQNSQNLMKTSVGLVGKSVLDFLVKEGLNAVVQSFQDES